MNYLSFDLSIEPSGDKYRARVVNSPGGEADAEFACPISEEELKIFRLETTRARPDMRRREANGLRGAKEFGQKLYGAVFTGLVGACLVQSLERSKQSGAGLRIRIDLSRVPELSNLPWEYLYEPSQNLFLALSKNTPVLRYLNLPVEARSRAVKLPARMLVVISGPKDLAPLDVDREWKELQNGLARLTAAGILQVERLEKPSFSRLLKAFERSEYQILHFIGHGQFDEAHGEGVLMFEDEEGKSEPITAQALGVVIHDAASLRLAVLNFCEGAVFDSTDLLGGTAQTLIRLGIPAVIAMQSEISEGGAQCFAEAFYESLVAGTPVDAALTAARKTLYATGSVEWGAPVLYTRSPDGQLFEAGRLTAEISLNDVQVKARLDRVASSATKPQVPPAAPEPTRQGEPEPPYGLLARPPLAPPPSASASASRSSFLEVARRARERLALVFRRAASKNVGLGETTSREGPFRPSGGDGGSHAPPRDEERFINAKLDLATVNEGLKVGQQHTIVFDVDVQERTASLATMPFLGKFTSTEPEMELTVQLSSDDFEIKTGPQPLRVPRRGKSLDEARFDFVPKREGPGTIQAVFLKNGNFIQLATVHLDVGAPAAVATSESVGRPLDCGLGVQPRDVTLILTTDNDGFKAILARPVAALATLAINRAELDQMITQARDALLSVVRSAAPGGSPVYQTGVTIPETVNQDALRVVAEAGFRLFQRMFFGPAADAQSKLIGQTLRDMARKTKLKIQIVSKDFLLPWGILYMANAFDRDHIDPELFLGFKHIIEHIPLQQGLHVTTAEIDGRPRFSVSLNLNSEIDKRMGIDVIARQRAYWKKVRDAGKTNVTIRETDKEVKTALANPSLPDQLLYFYCHAVSQSLAQGGPDDSALVFTGNGQLTLHDLFVFAPMEKLLKGSPLVFINACESAEMSPLFYDGFVPYFMGKGARGVIGTECLTPALFAAEWAERFFDQFLNGQPVGAIVLDLRQVFLRRHNNLLGLLYAVYCDGDTQLIAA